MQNAKPDLKQRCFRFSVQIIRFVETLPTGLTEQIIARQLLRSATSIGANIVESYGSPSKKDFSNYFSIALKSARETKYWLCLLKETNKGDQKRLAELIKECDELSRIIAASILTIKGKR